MRNPPTVKYRSAGVLALALSAGLTAACSNEPRTDVERLARGREIIDRMSAKLGSSQAFSVTTREIRDRIKVGRVDGQVTLTRETTIRHPDRLHFKASGGTDNEGWYDS